MKPRVAQVIQRKSEIWVGVGEVGDSDLNRAYWFFECVGFGDTRLKAMLTSNIVGVSAPESHEGQKYERVCRVKNICP